MDIKTGSNINLDKNKSVKNGLVQTFQNITQAEQELNKDGLFGYVSGDGVYININGIVTKLENKKTKTYTLPQSLVGGSSLDNGNIILSNNSLEFTIRHNLKKDYPNVVAIKSSDKKYLKDTEIDIIYIDNNTIKLILISNQTLTQLGYDIIVRIS